MSKLRTPVIIVNYKAYEEVEGSRGAMISGICEEVAKESGVSIVVSPPQVQLSSTASLVDIPVLAQHVDAFTPGSRTGWITPSMVKAAGAKGTLINHSEHPVSLDNIAKVVALCKELDLVTVVCADTVDTARDIAPFGPDFIAVEPPELIGGDISVTTAKPEVVSDAVKAVHEVDPFIKVLCGAGVKTGNDVKVAIELGAEGVLLASGVVKASSIKSALRELIQYL
ncbi:MAG TPA: triose-phosphate isomerase [Methanomassiliicoccales archaeon]|nr:triose-phosphate isomerase [Methanomassiliicoccales archaeon]